MRTSSRLNIGLVGAGRIARAVHLPVLAGLPGVEVRAVAERDPRAREIARPLAPAADLEKDYRALLERADLDAVVLCLPSQLHAEAAVAVLQANKHLYLEKPLALNREEGERVLAAGRASGRVAMMGFNYRFHPLYREARRLVRANRLGPLTAIRSRFCSAPGPLPEWKKRRTTGGGVLVDLASHHVDLLRHLTGEHVVEVSATLRSEQTEDDTASLQMVFGSGLVTTSSFSLCAGNEDWLVLEGRKCSLGIDRHRSLAPDLRAHPGRIRRWPGTRVVAHGRYALTKLLRPAWEPSYHAALSHFVQAAAGSAFAGPGLDDGFSALAIRLAAERSAREGGPVALAPHTTPNQELPHE